MKLMVASAPLRIRCTVGYLRTIIFGLDDDDRVTVLPTQRPVVFDRDVAIGNARVAFARLEKPQRYCRMCGDRIRGKSCVSRVCVPNVSDFA
jgi:hypothetical protein